ncbi:hypothetical protein [Paremcibacter congregatus]|uniref:hypothetical protein n=1 Tax=Paremcibacter congregatus TaxID=2043170 RepID=UPI0030EC7BD7|tara:strand:- start:5291 stop:5821 length:531 start_codon:yes stop_codon:yes gene_type:complete
MSLPKKCLVDTNVPKTANLATQPDHKSNVPCACVLACIKAIEHVIENRGLVIDAGGEIFNEYLQQLSMSGQPGVGDSFMKWVHDNLWSLPESDRVTITKNGESYDAFPDHAGLANFDNSDRKFVAASNAHPAKPPILQATDSKWWGWKDSLVAVGITVHFLCPEYAKDKCAEKMDK